MSSSPDNGAAWLAAWAAVTTGAVTALLAAFAAWQLLQAARVRREETRPYIIVDFDFRSILIYVAIRNIGRTMALNTHITFNEPLTSSLGGPLEVDSARVFKEPIPMLAPGRTIAVLLDSYPARADSALPMAYTVRVTYEDDQGRRYSDPPYPLDLATYRETALPPKGIDELVGEVERLRKEVAKWTDGTAGLRVSASNRDLRGRKDTRYVRRRTGRQKRSEGWRAWAQWRLQRVRRRWESFTGGAR